MTAEEISQIKKTSYLGGLFLCVDLCAVSFYLIRNFFE